MNLMSGARGVVLFFYRFLVGDDPIVAVVILIGLGVTGVLAAHAVNAWWLVPPVAVAMTGLSLLRHNRLTTAAR